MYYVSYKLIILLMQSNFNWFSSTRQFLMKFSSCSVHFLRSCKCRDMVRKEYFMISETNADTYHLYISRGCFTLHRIYTFTSSRCIFSFQSNKLTFSKGSMDQTNTTKIHSIYFSLHCRGSFCVSYWNTKM